MPFLRDSQNRLLRKDGSVVENAQRGRAKGPLRRKAAKPGGRASHLRVDAILGGAGPVREEYEKLAEDPNTYLKGLQAFLRERCGQHATISAVKRHRDRYRDEFRSLREASRMASAFCEITRQSGPGAIAEAAAGRFEMLLMQDLFKLKENPQLAPEEWQRWSRAVTGAVATRRSVEALRAEVERKAAEEREGEEEKGPPASNREVVERVREILGV